MLRGSTGASPEGNLLGPCESHWQPFGYDEAKQFTEATTMAYHRTYNVDTRIVRIFNTYGPRMQLNDGRVVPNFIKQALTGEDLTVDGDGSQTRSFCYASDEIDGFPATGSIPGALPRQYWQPIRVHHFGMCDASFGNHRVAQQDPL